MSPELSNENRQNRIHEQAYASNAGRPWRNRAIVSARSGVDMCVDLSTAIPDMGETYGISLRQLRGPQQVLTL